MDYVPDGFKTTEVGTLPEEWGVVGLGDVTEKTKQKDPRKTPEWRFKYVDVSSISRDALKIAECKLCQGNDAPSRAKKLVKKNDVIFATVRPTLKRLTLIDEKFDGEICSTAFCVLRARENTLSPSYMFYAIQIDVFINELGKIQRGASYPAVTDSDIKNQKIPLPPLPEQHRIAAVLSAVQDAKEKTGAVIVAAKSLKKSLLRHLFTYGPVPAGAVGGVPLAETEIGLVPEGWGILPISQVSEVIMGQSPPGGSYNTNDVGVPLINGPAEFGESFPRSTKWTVSPTKTCVRGDILFCVRGNTTGRMNVADTEYCIGRGVAAIRGIDGLSETSYLFYFLKKEAGTILKIAIAGGSTFPNITKSQLRNFSTPTPPLPTQQKIAHILSTVDKKIEAEENKKKALERLFKTLLNNLMTAKIRVDDMVI
jgi:type I restriction enzyme S subunit